MAPATKETVQPTSSSVGSTTAEDRDGRAEHSDAYAANLWRILNTPEMRAQTKDDVNVRAQASQPVQDIFAAPYGIFDHKLGSIGQPIELESTEIRYVHGNSLTGHANERAEFPVPTSEEDIVLFEESASMTPVQEWLYDMNEFVVDPYSSIDEGYADAVIAALDLSPLEPRSDAKPEPLAIASIESGRDEEELSQSDAHFQDRKSNV